MALNAYILRTQQLLQYPAPASGLYSATDITSWINQARGQLAADGECVRAIGTISTTAGQPNYLFSAISFSNSAIAGPLYVRRITYSVGDGQQMLDNSSWEWFDQFYLNRVEPKSGEPRVWAQYAQGSTGSFYIDPQPDQVYTLNCDCNCYPIALVDDTTVEVIPYLWTDAVPYYAAYLALLSAQTGDREAEAQRMFQLYQTFVARARGGANPPVNRYLYEQAPDPAQAAKTAQKGG